MHEPSYADDATGHGAKVLVDDGLDYLSLHLPPDVGVVYYAEVIWQHIGGDGIVAIVSAVGIEYMARYCRRAFLHGEVLTIEGFLRLGSLGLEPFGIGIQFLHSGIASHHAADVEVIGRGDKCHVGGPCWVLAMDKFFLFRWQAPVGIFPAKDQSVALVLGLQVLQPPFHVRIVFPQRLIVAIVANEHRERHGQGSRPGEVVAIVVPEGRSHVGNASVLALCLGDVSCPLGIERLTVEQERLAETAPCAVAQPGLPLIALWTVHRHALVVREDAPPRILIYLI